MPLKENLGHSSVLIKRQKKNTNKKQKQILQKYNDMEPKEGSCSGTSKRSRKSKSIKSKTIKNIDQDEDQENDLLDVAVSESEILSSDNVDGSLIMQLDISDSDESVSEDPAVHRSMKKFEDQIYYRKLDSRSLLVSINPFNNLYFSGKCAIKVLKGAVEICGFEMTRYQPTQEAFSPKGSSSLLYIRGVSRQTEFDTEEVTEEFENNVPQEEMEDLPGAVIIIKSFDNEWSQGLRHFLPHGEALVGPSITGMGSVKLPKMKNFMEKMGFQFIPQFMKEKSRLFETSPDWENIFPAISTCRIDEDLPPRVCIFGGKGVGKSTFTRWMVNKLLSSGNKAVLYIDIDPGQAEFTPPGVVSVVVCEKPLLGPNFTHLQQPTRSIYLGGVNVADFPVSYLNALVQLVEFTSGDEQLSSMPWVINTMGFTQGLGVHLAVGCINVFQPSNVIQLSIRNERRSFPFNLNHHNVQNHRSQLLQKNLVRYPTSSLPYKFFNIESVCNRVDGSNDSSWGPSPKALRENVIASYFSELIGSTNDYSFISVLPCNISLNQITIGTMNSDLNYAGILRSIKGNLVALCECTNNLSSRGQLIPSGNDQESENRLGSFISKAEIYSNTFYGYGIVRAIDEESNILHVVTPLADNLKSRINTVIASGNIGLPIQFYIGNVSDKSDVSQLDVPYVLNMREGKSKLHMASKKYYSQKRVTHSVLRNSLL